MTLEWWGPVLVITWLPVEAMGRLAACAPATRAETEVLAALMAGARVCLGRDALAYRRYRHTAPPGVYRACVALERQLREMGIGRLPSGWDRGEGHAAGTGGR